MNAKQAVVGIVVGAIAAAVLGYLIFDLIMGDFYASHLGSATGVIRDSQVWWAVIIGAAGYAAMIVYVLGLQAGKSTLVGGLVTGAIVGFLMWLTADFTLLGVENVSTPTLAVIDPILELIRGAITGAAIGLAVSKL